MTGTVNNVSPKRGVLTLSGYALRIAVERGHLVVEDGVANERRKGRFSRVTKDLKRVLVIGHSGTVSLEALRWLHDVGAAFIQIDNDGRVITAAGPIGLNDARLRRAQALAVANGTGIAIARDLVRAKLEAQAALVDPLPTGSEAAVEIRRHADETAVAESIEDLRLTEAHAANRYWKVWREVPIQFISRDKQRVPDHWQTFGSRSSLISGSPKRASNPANAMLNYLYAILEAEARLAILAVGCDPGIGVIHADQEARDSFSCDVMETVRPQVDAMLLDTLATRAFRKADFFERHDGVCRIMPPLTHYLAETGPTWRNAIAPVVEDVAQRFIDTTPYNPSPGSMRGARKPRQWSPTVPRLPTVLTGSNRSAARDRTRSKPKREAPPARSSVPRICTHCGRSISRGRLCIDCYPPERLQQAARARTKLREKRETGKVKQKDFGEKQAAHRRKIAEWNRAPSSVDPEHYRRHIWPTLKSTPVIEIARATGLSYSYCNHIKNGKKIPHPRWWERLGELVPGQ